MRKTLPVKRRGRDGMRWTSASPKLTTCIPIRVHMKYITIGAKDLLQHLILPMIFLCGYWVPSWRRQDSSGGRESRDNAIPDKLKTHIRPPHQATTLCSCSMKRWRNHRGDFFSAGNMPSSELQWSREMLLNCTATWGSRMADCRTSILPATHKG